MTNLTLFTVVFLIFQNNVLSNSQAHECMENLEDEANTDQHLLEFHILEAKYLINLEKIKYIAQLDAALETETNQLQAELKRTDSEVKILTEKRDHQFSEELIQLGLEFAAKTKKFVQTREKLSIAKEKRRQLFHQVAELLVNNETTMEKLKNLTAFAKLCEFDTQTCGKQWRLHCC